MARLSCRNQGTTNLDFPIVTIVCRVTKHILVEVRQRERSIRSIDQPVVYRLKDKRATAAVKSSCAVLGMMSRIPYIQKIRKCGFVAVASIGYPGRKPHFSENIQRFADRIECINNWLPVPSAKTVFTSPTSADNSNEPLYWAA